MKGECCGAFDRIDISGLFLSLAKSLGYNVHGSVLNSGNWSGVSVKFGKIWGANSYQGWN